LPFSFAEGDPISGSFTFEPVDVASSVETTELIQSGAWTLNVDSVRLHSDQYLMQVIDNGISDEDPVPHDRIVLSCRIGSECQQGPINGYSDVQWSFSMTLLGAGSILNGSDIPEDVGVWRQFTPGSILVSFQDTSIGRGTGFQATIDTFEGVPEQGTLGAATYAIVIIVSTFAKHRTRDCK
jgi:hypothetical protein